MQSSNKAQQDAFTKDAPKALGEEKPTRKEGTWILEASAPIPYDSSTFVFKATNELKSTPLYLTCNFDMAGDLLKIKDIVGQAPSFFDLSMNERFCLFQKRVEVTDMMLTAAKELKGCKVGPYISISSINLPLLTLSLT